MIIYNILLSTHSLLIVVCPAFRVGDGGIIVEEVAHKLRPTGSVIEGTRDECHAIIIITVIAIIAG